MFQSSETMGIYRLIFHTSKMGHREPSALPTGTKFQSTEESLQESPSAPSGVRTRRTSRSLAAIESVLAVLRKTAPAEGHLPTQETQQGVVALLSWAAGGDAKKARSFLRKLGAKPPSDM